LRRATFSGDDLATPLDERFREIAYGMTEWGSWYQGEITGEYALGNGNLDSRLARLTLAPTDAVTFDVLYYRFTLEQPASFGATADDWGGRVGGGRDRFGDRGARRLAPGRRGRANRRRRQRLGSRDAARRVLVVSAAPRATRHKARAG
jgi:hypothetical protein